MLLSRATPVLLCCLGLLILLSRQADAQESTPGQTTARAAGLVRTQQGVAVPGATIRMIELATGRAWVTWTGENGKFDLQGLPPGKYRIELEQIGFEPASQEIELTPAASPETPQAEAPGRLPELTLRVAPLAAILAANRGNQSTTPPATPATPDKNAAGKGAAPGASSNSGAGASTTANKPGPQRNANAAGPDRQRQGRSGFQQVDINGQLSSAVPDISQSADTGPLGEASSADAVLAQGTVASGTTAGTFPGFGGPGQFGGQPDNFGGNPAVFPGQPGMPGGPGGQPGMPGGGAGGRGGGGGRGQGGGRQGEGNQQWGEGAGALYGVQRILRQQANRVRFSFFERYGNSAFDARPYSLTQANPPKIADYRENWGASLGGPFSIPKVYNGRDKTFFFLNYSGARSRNPVDTFATVPTQDERSGNFCAPGAHLFNPFSVSNGQRASLGCQLPSSFLTSPSAQIAAGLLQFVPLPNLPGTVQNFHLQTRVPTATDAFNMRVLHTISPKLNARVIYNFSEARTHSFSNFPALEGSSGTRGQSLQLGLTQNYSPRFTNDSLVVWTRRRTNSLNTFSFVDDVAGHLGITGISPVPIDFGIPEVNLTNFTGLSNPVPALRRNQTTRAADNVSYILPKHTMKFGAELRRMQLNTVSDPIPNGLFTFTGLMTAQLANGKPVPDTGFDFADFLLGLPQATSIRFGSSSTYFRNWGVAVYAMDDWHLHPRFTLSYGLRYEALTPPVELFDHIADLAVNSGFTQVATVTPGVVDPFTGAAVPQSLVQSHYLNFSPRLGFAWRPKIKGLSQKHTPVVRGGYSVFYNLSIYNTLATEMANQPPFAQAQTQQTCAPPIPCTRQTQQSIPQQILTFQNGFPPAPPSVAKNTIAVDPNYRPGYAQIWNLAIEEQLTTSTVLDVTYTGTRGSHLDLQSAPNRTPPGVVSSGTITGALGFTYDSSGASSVYHALQVRLQRRFTKGLMVLGTYTFGKSIDNASSIGGGAPVVVQDFLHPELDRGLSSFDVRHQLRASFLYEFPFGERKRWARAGWKEALFGNWSLSGNTQAQSGTPYTAIYQGFTTDNSGNGNSFSERADQVTNPNTGPRTPLDWFNTAAFVAPPPGRFGNAGRNTIIGPGSFVFSTGLAKQFRVGRDNRRRVDFRWDVSNITNTPSFTGLSAVVNSATVGRVLGTQTMRQMSFQLRMHF